jgi:class 3 adenylate cyclase
MRELPRGTVTFLFTDIEGSTRLLKELGEAYGAVLAEHQRLLREAFEAAGSQEIDTQGDSFFIAFPRAKDGVRGAIAGQRALAAHRWPEDAAVRVGMEDAADAIGDSRFDRELCRRSFHHGCAISPAPPGDNPANRGPPAP